MDESKAAEGAASEYPGSGSDQVCGVEEHEEMEAMFSALLAVAKGIVADWSDPDDPDELGPHVAKAMAALDTAHPGWREWTP